MKRLLLVLALGLVPFAPKPAFVVNQSPPVYGYNRFDLAATIRYGHPVYAHIANVRAKYGAFAVAFIVAECEGSVGGTDVTSDAVTSTGANLEVVYVAENNLSDPAVTDSKSNSYTAGTNRPSFPDITEWYVLSPTVGTGHTVTATIASNPAVCVGFYSGVHASPLDVSSAADGGATTCQAGSITPTVDNTLVTAASGQDSTDVLTINESYTIRASVVKNADGSHYGLFLADKTQGAASATNPTWTAGVTHAGVCAIRNWKEAAAGGTPMFGPLLNHFRIGGGR